MPREIAEAPPTTLGKILLEGRFAVPTHQRDYSWTDDEVGLLISDVEAAIERTDSEYFVGLMVFMGSDNGEEIVLDGQQRLATAVILFSAIRNWLQQYSQYMNDANKIQEWFIGRSELGETIPTPRLILNTANHQAFLQYIIASVPPQDIRAARDNLRRYDRNRRLLNAALFCHDKISEIAAGLPSEEVYKNLIRLVQYFRDSLSVVRLRVTDEEAAFTIFETLNDRGLELSPLDLVKNYLFRRAAEKTGSSGARTTNSAQMRNMEDRWVQMMQTLNNVKADSFIKALWTSRHGRIQATNLFGAFKKEYNNSTKSVGISVDMLAAAEQYAALETSDDPTWSEYSREAQERVRSLKLLGAQQTHPVILSALQRFPIAEVEKLLRLLEVLIVRYQLIGGGRTGRLEIVAARIARAIYVKEIADNTGTRRVVSAADVFRESREIYPSDDTFEQQFAIANERNNQKAVYILRNLERERRRRDSATNPGELDPGALTVEHILPKNPSNLWISIIKADSTIREDCTYRLGNMCLLTGRMNRDAARGAFNEKKETYTRSELGITKAIAGNDVWDRTTIDQRQAHMVKLAVTAWRFQ